MACSSSAGRCPPRPSGTLQHNGAAAAAVIDDGRFELVADGKGQLAGFRVAKLGQVNGRFALGADANEGSGLANGDHPPAHYVTHCNLALARLGCLARGIERREVVIRGRGLRGTIVFLGHLP